MIISGSSFLMYLPAWWLGHLRPAIGGGNNDNFFHRESRVIRWSGNRKWHWWLWISLSLHTQTTSWKCSKNWQWTSMCKHQVNNAMLTKHFKPKMFCRNLNEMQFRSQCDVPEQLLAEALLKKVCIQISMRMTFCRLTIISKEVFIGTESCQQWWAGQRVGGCWTPHWCQHQWKRK